LDVKEEEKNGSQVGDDCGIKEITGRKARGGEKWMRM
jgi:hypothetical protein